MGYPGAFAYPLPPPDPNVFRRDYAARLSELTMNSRPIIQSLSMIAQDILRHPGPVFSDIVAQCLKAHISRVSVSFSVYRSLLCRAYLYIWVV